MPKLGLRLTPHGRLLVENQDDAPEIAAASSTCLNEAFEPGSGYGLVWLCVAGVGQALPPVFAWWRGFAARYIGPLCLQASDSEFDDTRALPDVAAPTETELASLILTAPMMAGAEYLTHDVLLALWDEMAGA